MKKYEKESIKMSIFLDVIPLFEILKSLVCNEVVYRNFFTNIVFFNGWLNSNDFVLPK